LINILSTLLKDKNNFAEIGLIIQFNYERAEVFHDIIENFEKSLGITHCAYNKIRNLWNHLRFNIYNDDFGVSINAIIEKHKLEAYIGERNFKIYIKRHGTS